jgi:hypothetical protein
MGNGEAVRFLAAVQCLAALAASASGSDYDPAIVLKRVTAKVIETTDRTPNFTCVQTVDRVYYRPVAATLKRPCGVVLEQRRHPSPDMVLREIGTDRLRLDVTLTDSGEVYSWAGASRFEGGIEQVVPYGPLGTGAFGAYLSVIFRKDVRGFRFERKWEEGGRTRLEYSFQVQQPESHYRIILPGASVFTAYQGSFVADAETADLVRVSVETVELPPASGNCMLSSTMDLQRVRIGEEDLLLPAQMRQRFVSPNGEEAENTTQFSRCREYRGESSIRYSDEVGLEPAGAQGRAQMLPAVVDAGLSIRFELAAPIDTRTAAAGDPFSGKLTEPLRDARGKTVVPKGSVVSGRLLRVQVDEWPQRESRRRDATTHGRAVGGACGTSYATKDDRAAVEGEVGAGVFRFKGIAAVVPNGFRSEWRTIWASWTGAASAGK